MEPAQFIPTKVSETFKDPSAERACLFLLFVQLIKSQAKISLSQANFIASALNDSAFFENPSSIDIVSRLQTKATAEQFKIALPIVEYFSSPFKIYLAQLLAEVFMS